MNKEALKLAWGKYCDTDKLVDDMMALLSKYHHRNTEHGVCKMLNTYFSNKHPLIDLLMKSEHYIGDMRVVVDLDLQRTSSMQDVRRFCDDFVYRVDAQSAILKYKDENGKTIDDYSKTGIKSLSAKDLLEDTVRANLLKNQAERSKFGNNGVLKESEYAYNDFCTIMNNFRLNYQPTISAATADNMQRYKINGRITAGMKTSRAFNRACTHYGVEKLPNYNKLFAIYSDMVSGLSRKMKFFISVNPLDYLTMSFGNSWASCHTIDKRNTRRMPNDYHGQYCGGTVSYMLDGSSIITYVHDAMPDSFEDGKVYRNMFHYNNGTLIQGRVYPQGNDGATDLYKTFRNAIQNELGNMLGITDSNWIKSPRNCGDNTRSSGVHYRDYLYQGDCNMSYIGTIPNAKNGIVEIGHIRVCPYCGEHVYDSADTGILSHHSCSCTAEV